MLSARAYIVVARFETDRVHAATAIHILSSYLLLHLEGEAPLLKYGGGGGGGQSSPLPLPLLCVVCVHMSSIP